MGVGRAGFTHEAVVERNAYACDTIVENQARGLREVCRWPLFQEDVRHFDYGSIRGPVDLLAGGPPCQPFSLGGKHAGFRDDRDMFPEVARAVRLLQPRAILVENVKGLLRQSFFKYFEYVLLSLTFPELDRKRNEDWLGHLGRLERVKTKGDYRGLEYNVVFRLLNAADYGVPQRRERVIIVGFRKDLGIEWSFPRPSHSQDALLRSEWITEEYWDRHRVAKKHRPMPTSDVLGRLSRLPLDDADQDTAPWLTVRDVIADLPDPRRRADDGEFFNHVFNPGARVYKGHTGSPLDEPAKTLKAGDHGVPGGENMLAYPNGDVRYFTVRESARLQTFPDKFVFHGSWTESMRQLGNAVPVRLGEAVARDVAACLA